MDELTKSMIEMLVYNMKPGTTNRTILRSLRRRFKKQERLSPAWREYRREGYRIALHKNAENQRLYSFMMGI